jgi:amidase
VHPECSSLDCVGPLAREVSTIERAMAMIDATFRPQDAPPRAVVGWVQVGASAEVSSAARGALGRAGVEVRGVALPTFAAAFSAALTIIGAEIWSAFGHLVGCQRLGPDVRTRLAAAQAISVGDVAAAETLRRSWRAEIDAALSGLDALALPTLPDLPLTLAAAADARAALHSSWCVRPFNLSGHPAITLPVAVQGVPAGLQLVGRAQRDEALCALARSVEGALLDERAARGLIS